MKDTYKRVGFRRAAAMLCMMLGYSAGLFAYIPEPEVEVDGVRYRLDYYRYFPIADDTGVPDYQAEDLENIIISSIVNTGTVCEAINNHKNLAECRTFRFQDGSSIPAFEYVTKVLGSNSPSNRSRLPRYDAEKDEMTKRYPYYTGEVWLQDSVLMADRPILRKTKYHIVCDFEGVKFNDELTFIRTPRYAVVPKGAFKDCTGLKTARIGAVQRVRSNAFENCTNLETVIFESLPCVDENAFLNCPNISKVIVEGNWHRRYWSDEDSFDEAVYENAILYVQGDEIESYKKHKKWGKFKNIRDIEEYVSGVEAVGAESAVEYRVYNLSGVLVRTAKSGQYWREGLPAGVYVVKSSLGNVRKEYVK